MGLIFHSTRDFHSESKVLFKKGDREQLFQAMNSLGTIYFHNGQWWPVGLPLTVSLGIKDKDILNADNYIHCPSTGRVLFGHSYTKEKPDEPILKQLSTYFDPFIPNLSKTNYFDKGSWVTYRCFTTQSSNTELLLAVDWIERAPDKMIQVRSKKRLLKFLYNP